MPIFKPDPTKATSGFLTYQKGTYRVELKEPVAFAGGKPGKENYGVRFPATIVSSIDQPGMIGKPFPQTCYQHTEGSLNYSKGIQMAALGCKKDDEFNEKFGAEDWGFNTDDKSCNGGWWKMKGQVIDIEVGETQISTETGDEQTGNMKFRPVLA